MCTIHPTIIRIIQLRSLWYSFGIPRASNESSTIASLRKHIFNSFKKIILIDYATQNKIIVILYLSKNCCCNVYRKCDRDKQLCYNNVNIKIDLLQKFFFNLVHCTTLWKRLHVNKVININIKYDTIYYGRLQMVRNVSKTAVTCSLSKNQD